MVATLPAGGDGLELPDIGACLGQHVAEGISRRHMLMYTRDFGKDEVFYFVQSLNLLCLSCNRFEDHPIVPPLGRVLHSFEMFIHLGSNQDA